MSLSNQSRLQNAPDVIDVEPRWSIQRFKKLRVMIVVSALVLAISVLAWWGYAIQLKPSRDQKLVDEALVILDANPDKSGWSARNADLPTEQKLIRLSGAFADEEECPVQPLCKQASRAALDIAIRNGSLEAKLELGMYLRDGDFGQKDIKAAAAIFDQVLNELQPGIKTREHDSLYVYSLMLKNGLGVSPNPSLANELLKEVALSRDRLTMALIGYSVSRGSGNMLDIQLAKNISNRLISMGQTQDYVIGLAACHSEFPEQEEFPGGISVADWKKLDALREDRIASCQVEFARYAANKGDNLTLLREMAAEPSGRISRSVLAKLELDKSDPSLNESRGSGITSKVDPDAQSRTGYLNGTKQLAQGGLSTFKIDNTKGGGDAVVRLYRDGKKPAARSMFVKNGESFTAEAVVAGAYTLRYRYIGSEATFEADETFQLSEIRTETGTRFSRAVVTLYKVANGNLTVKRVDSSDF